MAIPFKGFLLTAAGAGVNAATVDLVDRNTTTPVRETTTTNSDGFFTLSETTEGRYDVRITSGSDVIWRKYDTAGQMEEMEVATLKIRNPADTFAYDLLPAAITAARTLTLPLLTGTATIVVTPAVEDFVLPAFSVRWSSGVAVVGSEYSIQRDADGTNQLHLNVPSGATFELSVNDTVELVLSATSLDLQSNTLLNVGAAGNDWTTDALTLAGGAASQTITVQTTGSSNSTSLELKIPASGTGAPGVNFIQGDGTGSANNMSYLLSYVAGSSYFRLLSTDTDGASADADIWRVADGTQTMQFLGEIEVDGALNHDGSTVGFYGVAPASRSSGWTITNDQTDRSFDANANDVLELADIVATLITDLAATGIIGASA